jgi:cytochrome c oxidase subunit 2
VSKLTYTFDRIGEYPYICTEYCGIGHAAMFGTIKVVPAGEFEGSGA